MTEKKSCSCMADIKYKHRSCVDILTQVSAVQSALNAFNKELLGEHIKTCVVNDIRQGNDEVVDELVSLLQKMMK